MKNLIRLSLLTLITCTFIFSVNAQDLPVPDLFGFTVEPAMVSHSLDLKKKAETLHLVVVARAGRIATGRELERTLMMKLSVDVPSGQWRSYANTGDSLLDEYDSHSLNDLVSLWDSLVEEMHRLLEVSMNAAQEAEAVKFYDMHSAYATWHNSICMQYSFSLQAASAFEKRIFFVQYLNSDKIEKYNLAESKRSKKINDEIRAHLAEYQYEYENETQRCGSASEKK